MTALLKEINAKCGGDLAIDNVFDDYIPATSAFFVNSKQRPQKSKPLSKHPPCAFCSQAHASRLCPVVTEIDKRVAILKRDNKCFNCLASNHSAKKCRSRYTCYHCKAKHHSSICTTQAAVPPPNTSESPVETHVKFTPSSTPVLLKTATTHVQHGKTQTMVNILLDEGSQRSFVTEQTVQRLGIKIESCPVETLSISTFGDG